MGFMFMGCIQQSDNYQNKEDKTTLELAQEWDKVFPLSEKVNHRKVTFQTQYGLTLAAAGKGEPKNMIPWDTLADFFTRNL